MDKPKKIILDVDTGIDDALAIGYAVRSSDVELLGLTTCFGNVFLEKATRNTLYVLELLEADVPVVPGADRTFSGQDKETETTAIHGEDGLGNTQPPEMNVQQKALAKHASEFIVEQVTLYPNEVTLIFVGPLTNLALSLKRDPGIVDLVDRVVIMGGAVTVPGNVTPVAEANIYADPEAAQYVFESGLPITLVGLDVTMRTLLSQEEVQQWREKDTRLSRFFADMTDFYIGAYKKFNPGIKGCALHDPLAVGVVIDPTFVETKPMAIRVDLEGEATGRTVPDETTGSQPNVDVCLHVEADRFLEHFLKTISLRR